MRKLEEQFKAEIVVIGVHSGKYHAERISGRISDASIRLGAEHPTVNDRQFRVWRSYAVSAWPTLAVLDPNGYVVGTRADEFTSDMLALEAGALSSPWDVVLVGQVLYIAMAGVHQIWTLDISSGRRQVHAGTGGEDIRDGPSQGALLNEPGRVACGQNYAYVADTNAHRVLAVNYKTDLITPLRLE